MARLTGLLVLSMCLASPAAAQVPLTVDAAVSAAMQRNPALAAASAAVDRADAERLAARGAWFPRLNLSEGVQRGDQPVFAFGALLSARQFTAADFAIDRLNRPGATTLHTTRASISQQIFDGGRTSGQRAEATARLAAAQADADAAAHAVVIGVTTTIGQVASLDVMAAALDAALAAAREDQHRAQRRRDAGTATDADVLAADVHVIDLQQRRLQLSADRAAAAAQLNRLIGAAVDAPVTLAPLPAQGEAPSAPLATLLEQAESARPELRRADAQVLMAVAGQQQAGSVWWPQVAAQAGLEWNGLDFGSRSRSWVVGGELRWSVSLSDADRARTRAAASARVAAEHARDDVRASIHVEVVSALRRREAAVARLAVGEAAVTHATERARVTRNRYDAGLASMTDVLAAASAVLDAEARQTAVTVEVLTAGAELQRALGRQVWK